MWLIISFACRTQISLTQTDYIKQRLVKNWRCSAMFCNVLCCSMIFCDVLWCFVMFYNILQCSVMNTFSISFSGARRDVHLILRNGETSQWGQREDQNPKLLSEVHLVYMKFLNWIWKKKVFKLISKLPAYLIL